MKENWSPESGTYRKSTEIWGLKKRLNKNWAIKSNTYELLVAGNSFI